MNYSAQPDRLIILPEFVPDTKGTLLVPRLGVSLGAVIAPEETRIRNLNPAGVWHSTHRIAKGELHVMSHVGHQYGALFGHAGGTIFELGDEADGKHLIPQAMKEVWHEDGLDATVYRLFRRKPAYVHGEVSRQTNPGLLSCRPDFVVSIDYNGWPVDEQLLLISEMPTGENDPWPFRNLRLAPLSYLAREFQAWTSLDEQRVLHTFQYDPA